MKANKGLLIILNLILLLGYFTYATVKKEQILNEGQLVLLELAPVDPRSLMQGDYMQLNYAISDEITNKSSVPIRGYCVVTLDEKNRASLVRFQKDRTPQSKGEFLIEYTKPKYWSINIGAESFFFEEGQGKKYESAKYGALRIDSKGNSVLVGLYDEKVQEIK